MRKRESVKVYPVRFTVKTKGAFPADMLRYDVCRPATEHDANLINHSIAQYEGVTVELVAYPQSNLFRPTFGRWESFNCQVIKVDGDSIHPGVMS